MSRSTTFALGALVGGVTAALVGGIAWAAIPGSGGVIQGCYDKTGAVRVVDALPCPKGQTPLQWNQQGPTGTTGPQGPPGPPGAQGESATSCELEGRIKWEVQGFTIKPSCLADIRLEPIPNTLNQWTVRNVGPDAATVSVALFCDPNALATAIGPLDSSPGDWIRVTPRPLGTDGVLTSANPIPSGGELEYAAACLKVSGYTEVFSSDRYDPTSTPNNGNPSEDDYGDAHRD
jgi:hypothetical protein